MYFYSFEDEHHLNLHLVKSVPPVSWYFEVQQEVILKIKTILMTLRKYSVTCGVSLEVSCSKYFCSKYPSSKYPCSKTFMFKISLLKMSQQHVPRGGIFVVVFFKHYKMALWPISKTYEVNYAYLQ